MSDFIADVIYAPNGSGTGIGEVQDSELTMVKNWEINYGRYLSSLTGVTPIIRNITGFSEQVWLNGVRQYENVHYVKNFACASSGFVDAPNTSLSFYNNEDTFFDIG